MAIVASALDSLARETKTDWCVDAGPLLKTILEKVAA